MKTLDLFLAQVEMASRRTPDLTEETAANKASITGTPFSKELLVAPVQVSNYLEHHNVSLDRFINDRIFRERVIKGDDILDVNYLEAGMIAGKSVCRINIFSPDGDEGMGSGFLIAPGILITNHHVLPDPEYGRNSFAEFNYEKGLDGLPKTTRLFRFDTERLFYTHDQLDFTIIAVENTSADGQVPVSSFGSLMLNPDLGKTKEGNYVSIIQHPDGKTKKVALRENQITNLGLEKFIRYVTDTKSGSSGGPVFNDKWEVVALHHAGIPRYNANGDILNRTGGIWDSSQGELQIDWVENEGVRVSSIVYNITTEAAKDYPWLLDYFRLPTDVNAVVKATGQDRAVVEGEIYYPESKDLEDQRKYYAAAGNLDNPGFEVLHQLLKTTHTLPHNYSPSKFVYPVVDIHPDGLLRSIYSGKSFTVQELLLADQKVDLERQLKFIELSRISQKMPQQAFSLEIDSLEEVLPYNCEHVVCQSWFGKQEPMRGDLHHLFACETKCNSFRNNHAYIDFMKYDPSTLTEEKERPECGFMENDRFEPERNKGVVARAVFYFLVRYPKSIDVYTSEDINTLKKWATKEPVTMYEKHRNREIFLLQGNRNPFIDRPGLWNRLDLTLAL